MIRTSKYMYTIYEFISLLRKYPDFRVILVDQLIGQVTGPLLFIGLQWYIVSHGYSAAVIGISIFLGAVPELIFSWAAGKVVDRYSIKRIILVTQFLSVLLVLALWITLHANLGVMVIYAFSFFSGVIQAVEAPIFLSYLPKRMSEDDYYRANQGISITTNTVSALAPAVAGWIIAGIGPMASFLGTSGLMCAVVLISLLLKDAKMTDTVQSELDPPSEVEASSLRSIVKDKNILSLLLLRFVGNLGYAPFEVLIVLWINRVVHMGPEDVGLLYTALSTGAILGSLILGAIKNVRPHVAIAILNVLLGILLSSFVFLRSVPAAVIVSFAIGIILTADQILVDLIYQKTVPQFILGKVSGLRVAFSQGASTFGELTSGWMGGLLGISQTIGIGGVVVVTAGIMFLVMSKPSSSYASIHGANE